MAWSLTDVRCHHEDVEVCRNKGIPAVGDMTKLSMCMLVIGEGSCL